MAGLFPLPSVWSPVSQTAPTGSQPEVPAPAEPSISTFVAEVQATTSTLEAALAESADAITFSRGLPDADTILQEPLGPVADLNRMPPAEQGDAVRDVFPGDEQAASLTTMEAAAVIEVATGGPLAQAEGLAEPLAEEPAGLPAEQPAAQENRLQGPTGEAEPGPQGEVVDAGAGHAMVGQAVKKKFGTKNYMGVVKSYGEADEWYKVVYEDGDEEELTWLELEPLLSAAKQKKQLKQSPAKSSPATASAKRSSGRPKVPSAKLKAAKTKETLSPTPSKGGRSRKMPAAKRRSSAQTEKGTVGRNIKATGHPKGKTTKQASRRTVSSPANADRPLKRVKAADKAQGKADVEPKSTEEKKAPAPRGGKIWRKGVPGSMVSLEPEVLKAMSSPGPGRNIVGRAIKKDFNGQPYFGRIKQFVAATCFYKVVYEDNDEEDLDWEELHDKIITEEEFTTAQAAAAVPMKAQRANAGSSKASKKKAPAAAATKGQSRARMGVSAPATPIRAPSAAKGKNLHSPAVKASAEVQARPSRGGAKKKGAAAKENATPSKAQGSATRRSSRSAGVVPISTSLKGVKRASKPAPKAAKAAQAAKSKGKTSTPAPRRSSARGSREDPVVAEEPPAKRTRHQIHSPPAAATRGATAVAGK